MTEENQTTHASIAEALAAAQGEMTNPVKNCTNSHFKNKYADLGSVLDAVRQVLSRHGIALVQSVDGDGTSVTVSTRLLWGTETLECGSLTQSYTGGKNASQAMGSAITYARRYTVAAVCGVAPDDDDDANALEGAKPAAPTPRKPAKPPQRRAPEKEKAERERDGQLEAVRATLRGPVGCKSRADAVLVVHWATKGEYSYDSMGKSEEGPGEVLGAINELNEGKVPFENMLDWAYEKEDEESRRINQ